MWKAREFARGNIECRTSRKFVVLPLFHCPSFCVARFDGGWLPGSCHSPMAGWGREDSLEQLPGRRDGIRWQADSPTRLGSESSAQGALTAEAWSRCARRPTTVGTPVAASSALLAKSQ